MEDLEGQLRDYINVSPLIGMALASRKVTYGELCTVVSVEGLHDIVETFLVDSHNRRVIHKQSKDD